MQAILKLDKQNFLSKIFRLCTVVFTVCVIHFSFVKNHIEFVLIRGK